MVEGRGSLEEGCGVTKYRNQLRRIGGGQGGSIEGREGDVILGSQLRYTDVCDRECGVWSVV